MKYKICAGYGSKRKICKNEIPVNYWLCFFCWEERESNPTYKFSRYIPPELEKLTIKNE